MVLPSTAQTSFITQIRDKFINGVYAYMQIPYAKFGWSTKSVLLISTLKRVISFICPQIYSPINDISQRFNLMASPKTIHSRIEIIPYLRNKGSEVFFQILFFD